ncbi:MAG TPA: TIGR04282 family arsenosugar biosynthesis glycosyltransferase [Myxococcota bacterium]
MKRSRGALIVFAKAPRAGAVKTRLCPPFTPAEAAELYARLLADVLAASAELAGELRLTAILAVHPPQACGEIARTAPTLFSVVPQRGADLGRRMDWAVREACAGGAPRVLLRGSDSPLIDAEIVGEALAALDGADLVLRPDQDGGYGLVGLARHAPGLFDHPMSTATVLADTLANAARAGLCWRLLTPGFDVDTPADLRRLEALRSPRLARLCPATLAYLDERELWRRA